MGNECPPPHPTIGSMGERRISSPSGVRGETPAKTVLYHFKARKSHLRHVLNYNFKSSYGYKDGTNFVIFDYLY